MTAAGGSHDRTDRKDLRAVPGRGAAAGAGRGPKISGADAGLGAARQGKRIERTYKFKNFREALGFVDRVGGLAEDEGHHPDITFGWGYATISLHTHKIKGLHENDFIMAAKINQLAPEAT